MGHRGSRWEGGLSCCRSVARGNGQAGRIHTSGGFTRKRRTLVPSMLMEIAHKEIVPGTVVITLTGKLMMGLESEQIVTLVDELLSQGKRKIIFDLSGVKAIDSTGIGRFISSYNKVGAVDGDLRMAGATGHVFQTFHVSLLDTVFRFFPTLDEALAA